MIPVPGGVRRTPTSGTNRREPSGTNTGTNTGTKIQRTHAARSRCWFPNTCNGNHGNHEHAGTNAGTNMREHLMCAMRNTVQRTATHRHIVGTLHGWSSNSEQPKRSGALRRYNVE